MRKMSLCLVAGVALLVSVAQVRAQDIVYSAADANVAFTIKNSGSVAATFNVDGAGAGTNTLVVGSVTNSIDGSGTTVDTLTELATAIRACTNSAGEFPFTVDTGMSLLADSTDGELLTGAYTVAASGSGNVVWDTSAALFYSVYASRGDAKLIFGTPTGTGTLTLNVYSGGALVWTRLVASSNTSVYVEENFEGVTLPTGARTMARYVCGTTATTGNMGIVVGR